MRALPVEILESIFAQCTPDAVYIATHVCKTWRDVILQSHYVLDITLSRLSSRYGTLVLPKSEVRHIDQLRDLFEHLCYTNFLGSWLFVKPTVIDVKSLKFRNRPEDDEANECFSDGFPQIALRWKHANVLTCKHWYPDEPPPEYEPTRRCLQFVTANKGRMYEATCVFNPKTGDDSVAVYLEYETAVLSHVSPNLKGVEEIEEESSASPNSFEHTFEEEDDMQQGLFRPSTKQVEFLTKRFALTTIDDKKTDPSIVSLAVSASGTCVALLDNGSICLKSIFSARSWDPTYWYKSSPRFQSGYPLRYPTLGSSRQSVLRVARCIAPWAEPIDMAVDDNGTIFVLEESRITWTRPWVWEDDQLKPDERMESMAHLSRNMRLPKNTTITRIKCPNSGKGVFLYPGHLPLHSHTHTGSESITDNKLPVYEVLIGTQTQTESYAMYYRSNASCNMTVLDQRPNFLQVGPIFHKRAFMFESQIYNNKSSYYYVAIALDSRTGNFSLVRSETNARSFWAGQETHPSVFDKCWKVVAEIHGIKDYELEEGFKLHGHQCTNFAISKPMVYSGKISSIPNFKPKHAVYRSLAFAIGNEIYIVCVDMHNLMPVPINLDQWRHKKHRKQGQSKSKTYLNEFLEEDVFDLYWQKFTVKEPVRELAWIKANELDVFCTTEIIHLKFNEHYPRRSLRRKHIRTI